MKFQCHGCGEEAVEGSLCHELALLSCDSFLRYWCAECGGGGSERLEREHVSWVDVVHMILYYAIQSKEAEHTVEGLKFFHWRNICEEIEVYWPLLWDRDRTGNWQTSVVAALSTFAGVRFQSGKELVGKQLNGFWTLIDNVSPKEIEPPYPRAIDYEILPSGVLRPMERLSRDKHAEAEDSQERESRKLRKQMRKLAATLVFSNLDFDRPNPPGLVSISKLPTHTAPEIKFTEDLMITNDGGYRLARSTHGIDRGGRWYFEVYFHPPTSANQHIRYSLII